jgi:hypothetical protein
MALGRLRAVGAAHHQRRLFTQQAQPGPNQQELNTSSLKSSPQAEAVEAGESARRVVFAAAAVAGVQADISWLGLMLASWGRLRMCLLERLELVEREQQQTQQTAALARREG